MVSAASGTPSNRKASAGCYSATSLVQARGQEGTEVFYVYAERIAREGETRERSFARFRVTGIGANRSAAGGVIYSTSAHPDSALPRLAAPLLYLKPWLTPGMEVPCKTLSTRRRFMLRATCLMASALLLSSISAAQAATFQFDTDPFAGSTALTTPGRQVVQNEVFISNFSVAEDIFAFNPLVFPVGSQLTFFNGPAANLPSSGLNVIVLQDSDNDNNPATIFGAVASADLIAAQVQTSGAGFFLYFNSALQVNRLVYSTDLSSSTADLKILARLTTPTGQAAIDALPTFTASNFAIAAIPEPPTTPVAAFLVACFGLLAATRLRSPLQSVTQSAPEGLELDEPCEVSCRP